MNMIAETVIHDVSDPCHSARHAVRRDPPPTGSAWDESDYWMGLSIRYGRGELACLLAAMALSVWSMGGTPAEEGGEWK